jgi:hypothetical protein
MKSVTAIVCLAFSLAVPGRAEFLQMDISIFGMD